MFLLRQKLWFVMSLVQPRRISTVTYSYHINYFSFGQPHYIFLPYQSLQLWTTPLLLERLPLLEFSVKSGKHQNPDFCPKPGEIQKKPAKKYIIISGGVKLKAEHHFFCGKLSFILL
jgi:hypothetical protein